MSEFCRQAGGCVAGAPGGSGRAGGAGWRRDEPRTFDPSGNVGVPGNRGRQRLGQSPRCNGDDPTERDDVGDDDMDSAVEDGLVEGMQGAGVPDFGSDHIGIGTDHPGSFWRYSIRLDENGCPLPKHECIFEGIDRGEVPEGSQVGARTMVYGAVQIAGDRVRVNARFVNVETGEIIESARADANGTDAESIADAARRAFEQLGMPCSDARGLGDQHDPPPPPRSTSR
jgi:hypothetical protein